MKSIDICDIFWFIRVYIEKFVIRIEARIQRAKFFDIWDRCNSENTHKLNCGLLFVDRELTVIYIIKIFNNQFSSSLISSIKSIQQQSNPNWACLLFSNGSLDIGILSEFNDPRFHILNEKQKMNDQLILSKVVSSFYSKYITIINPGDILHPKHVEYLSKTNGDLIYFDHCIYNSRKKTTPFLKPQWSPELWLSVNILYGAAYRYLLIKDVIMKNDEKLFASAILCAKNIIHIPKILIKNALFPWQIEGEVNQHINTVHDYFLLQNIIPPVIHKKEDGSLELDWLQSCEKVSIIIPNRDNTEILKKCLESIYLITDYPNYEIIIVDDNSQNKDLNIFYQKMSEERNNFHVITGEKQFNFSRSCNLGSRVATGDFYLFLNNDTEVISPKWLKNMVGIAKLPCVGAVGAKLLYPNKKIQHAGVVIGLEGHASHVYQGSYGKDYLPYAHVDWMRNVSSVTAACMLVTKQVFWDIGGFDERFQIAFGDIDLCLRLLDANYRIVYVPSSCLIHYEGRTRNKFIPSQDITMRSDYFLKKVSQGDPYYHPSLSLAWRIPTSRRSWEQDPTQRLRKIIKIFGDEKLNSK